MISELLKNKRIVVIAGACLITIVLIAGYFLSGDDPKPKTVTTTTTTTTLPAKNAQACEFLTTTALLAGGIIPDVDPKTTDDKKRCTYEDIGGEVNYITLYVDDVSQCPTLIAAVKDPIKLPEVSPTAIFSDEMDPTIYVSQGTRCFFVQGSKTIIDKQSLTAIAKSVTDLFVAVDSTTTTTTQATVVLPEVSITTLPGQNTAPTTTVPSS